MTHLFTAASKLPLARKKPKPKPASRRDIILIIAAVILIPLVIIAFVIGSQISQRSYEGRVQNRLFTFCSDVTRDAGVDMEPCVGWPESSWVSNRTAALACHELSPTLDAPFAECLANKGVTPPGVIRTP